MLKVSNRLTFRQVFFTMCILLIANMAVLLFVFATPKAAQTNTKPTTFAYDHDGACECDGLDPNCTRIGAYNIHADYPYDDEMRENMRAYQLDFNDAGDVVVYDGKRIVGVLQYNTTCQLHKLMDRDND